MDRGSGIDEKTTKEEQNNITESSDLSPDQNGDMPVETVKVVGLRKVPGQPLGLTVSQSLYINNFISVFNWIRYIMLNEI